jgi:hypothetical protein
MDLHVAQILRDREERRRRQGGGHRLPDVDVARDHRTVDRGPDDRVLEIELGAGQLRLRGRDLGHARSREPLGGCPSGQRGPGSAVTPPF